MNLLAYKYILKSERYEDNPFYVILYPVKLPSPLIFNWGSYIPLIKKLASINTCLISILAWNNLLDDHGQVLPMKLANNNTIDMKSLAKIPEDMFIEIAQVIFDLSEKDLTSTIQANQLKEIKWSQSFPTSNPLLLTYMEIAKDNSEEAKNTLDYLIDLYEEDKNITNLLLGTEAEFTQCKSIEIKKTIKDIVSKEVTKTLNEITISVEENQIISILENNQLSELVNNIHKQKEIDSHKKVKRRKDEIQKLIYLDNGFIHKLSTVVSDFEFDDLDELDELLDKINYTTLKNSITQHKNTREKEIALYALKVIQAIQDIEISGVNLTYQALKTIEQVVNSIYDEVAKKAGLEEIKNIKALEEISILVDEWSITRSAINIIHKKNLALDEQKLAKLENEVKALEKETSKLDSFNPVEGGETTLYYLRLRFRGKAYYKIGVTLGSVEKRYPKKDFEVIEKIIYEKKLTHANTIEKQVISEFKDKAFPLAILSSGQTEIFDEDVLKLDV